MPDTTAPRGALLPTPAFSAPGTNLYGLDDAGGYANPIFVDMDGDGDLDAFIGNQSGNTLVYLNTGTVNSPAFAAHITNPYGLGDAGGYASPSLVDIDADGDLDALVGNRDGNTVVQLNTGTASSPAFAAASTNPYGLGGVGSFASPSFVDIDGDGDLDAFIGNQEGNTLVQLNTGTASSPAFAVAITNPYGLGDAGNFANPSFVDIDADGDFDALAGHNSGHTLVYLNTGTSSSPAFAAASTNPYGLVDVGSHANPSLVDIDGDSDLDALIGNSQGNTLVFINTANRVAPVASATANGNYGVGGVITLTVAFNENVNVNTTGGIPTLALETGVTDRFAVYTGGSGTSTLTFIYTVVAGDGNADLDFTSSSALALNGGTIQDAAGNNAILTLAEPGAVGSLAANHDLVIDATPAGVPTATLVAATLGATGSATVQSSETGTAYLVNTLVAVTHVASITGAADGFWNAVAITSANTNTALAVTGLSDGSYRLYTADAAGNLSSASAASVTIDATGPHGALAGTPVFATPSTNAYGLSNVGSLASPSLVDIDGDGDLDAFIGNYDGNTLVQLNTGTAISPAFAAASTNPYGLGDVGSFASPGFVDIDGDGDLDAFIGNQEGNTLVQLNTGTASSPAFAAASTNPYGLVDVGSSASPSFADIDGDGDLDAFIGNQEGNTLVQLNTGTASSPVFAAASTNPYGLVDVGSSASPSFVDIDGDGDLDAFVGERYGNTRVQLNTGTASSPAFAAASTNPYGLANVGSNASPSFADIDGDGDLDAFIGDWNGNTVVYLNTGSFAAPVTSSTANGSYKAGDIITLQIAFNENVIVNTTGGTPMLALETGTVDRFASYSSGSGTSTLTFIYTVQAGDASADLDFTSSTALALNGGTIQDAAGNNAVLTLAAPGATGSLATNANLVITGIVDSSGTDDVMRGSAANDNLDGAGGNDRLAGREGNDLLNGGEGDDKLFGEEGDDNLLGGNGRDALNGGEGADTMAGGDGNDFYYVDDADDVVTEAATVNSGTDTVYSYIGSYTLGANIENGTIKTSSAASLTGNGLNNILYGSNGNDSLDGAAGNDTLTGGDGADQLTGGAGRDVLTGGADADTFIFQSGSGRDYINDFSHADGDKISLQSNLNGSGITDAASALAHVSDKWGSAVLDLGGGNVVKLTGLVTADLTVADFMVF